jgi:phytoene synthase
MTNSSASIARREIVAYSQQTLAKGSQSFAFAAGIFGRETFEAAAMLYSWCRYADDEIDSAGAPQQARLDALRSSTLAIFEDETKPPVNPAFAALGYVVSQHRIHKSHALELIEGMAMDVRQERYQTLEDLLVYCYRVAGVVGAMMACVMRAKKETALTHAIDLGNAMQLTNIARDVLDDARMGRVYLPLEWLAEAGIPAHDLQNPIYRDRLAGVVARLLAVARNYYASGERGLRFLPFRAAYAVACASHIYAGIGDIVLARGARAWDQRAYVPLWKKIVIAVRVLAERIVARRG